MLSDFQNFYGTFKIFGMRKDETITFCWTFSENGEMEKGSFQKMVWGGGGGGERVYYAIIFRVKCMFGHSVFKNTISKF